MWCLFVLLFIFTDLSKYPLATPVLKCQASERVQNRRILGQCKHIVTTSDACFERGIKIGVLKHRLKEKNLNFWGPQNWPFFPKGCLHMNGIVIFNTNTTKLDCGVKPNVECICMPSCYKSEAYKIEHSGEIAKPSRNSIRACFDQLAHHRNQDKLGVLFLGVSTLGLIWNEFSNVVHEKASKCQHGVPQVNSVFSPHTLDFHRWNFISPASNERGHGTASEDIKTHPFCDLPQAPRRLLHKLDFINKNAYSKIVVQVGAWDATWGNSPSAFEMSLDRAVKHLVERSKEMEENKINPWDVILLTQSPEGHHIVKDSTRVYGHDWKSLQSATTELNQRIRKVAMKYRTALIDVHSMVLKHPRRGTREFWEKGAGWHMSRESGMSKAIAEEIIEKMCSPVVHVDSGARGKDNFLDSL